MVTSPEDEGFWPWGHLPRGFLTQVPSPVVSEPLPHPCPPHPCTDNQQASSTFSAAVSWLSCCSQNRVRALTPRQEIGEARGQSERESERLLFLLTLHSVMRVLSSSRFLLYNLDFFVIWILESYLQLFIKKTYFNGNLLLISKGVERK